MTEIACVCGSLDWTVTWQAFVDLDVHYNATVDGFVPQPPVSVDGGAVCSDFLVTIACKRCGLRVDENGCWDRDGIEVQSPEAIEHLHRAFDVSCKMDDLGLSDMALEWARARES